MGSKLYWYGSGGEILSETNAAGVTLNDYVFFGGRRVALVPATGSTLYYAEDFLGSSRAMVQSTGTLCYDADFGPFGYEKTQTNTCPTNYKFEGKERDVETQNDNFGAREYSWRMGRWLSSDWSAVPVAVPYANLTNPQTLNLYSMVADDPESFADLDGHQMPPLDRGGTDCANGHLEQCSQATRDEAAKAAADAASKQQPAQNLSVPPEVKAAIADSVRASNSPTADDKNGGYHEEGGIWGTTTSGGTVVAPAKPGPYSGKDDKTAHIDPANSVNPSLKDNMRSLGGTWHVHPRGGSVKTFVQPPSGVDKTNAVAPINIVVGAENKRVYFYNSTGVVREMSLKDFMKEPQ